VKSVRTLNVNELAEGDVLLLDMDDDSTWKIIVEKLDSAPLGDTFLAVSKLDSETDEEISIGQALIKHLQVEDPIQGLLISNDNPLEIAGKLKTPLIKRIEIYSSS
jgi:hypothetical protein